MNAPVTITMIVGFLTIMATLFGIGIKFKKDIEDKIEQKTNAKVSESMAEFRSEIYPQINDLKEKQVEMHTDIKWIIKKMNGGG